MHALLNITKITLFVWSIGGFAFLLSSFYFHYFEGNNWLQIIIMVFLTGPLGWMGGITFIIAFSIFYFYENYIEKKRKKFWDWVGKQ